MRRRASAERRRRGATVAAGAAIVALILPAGATAGAWDPAPVDPHETKLFDAGVADADADGNLDLFTVNHNYRGSMLINDGAASFTDRLYDLGLGQDSQFPGLESQGETALGAPGVYLAVEGTLLRIRGHGIDGARRLRVRFLSPTQLVSDRRHAEVRLSRRGPGTVADLKLRDGADVRLSPELVAVPVDVRLRAGLEPEETFVGSQAVAAPGEHFALTLRDRHAFAWADLDADADVDAFVARGGLKGKIGDYAGLVDDELLLGGGGSFEDEHAGSGLVKARCRGRSAAAVDFDADGLLDLFEGCEDTAPRLYRRRADGTFANASGGLRDAGVTPGVARWADLDGDARPELISAGHRRLEVFSSAGGGFRRVQGEATRNARRAANLALADFDRDGDPDLFEAAPTGNTLLVNHGGELRARHPHAVGLPARGLWAGWTDADNDGRVDLDIQPGGLRRQAPSGEFAAVSGPDVGGAATQAVGAWPDADSDGSRDSLLFWRPRHDQRWRSSLKLQAGPEGHWLELDPGAASAGEIGARIEVTTGEGTQTGWIGESETSLRSQGHYRVYFGLGNATAAEVEVAWPDGTGQDLGTVAADQLLSVSR